ncbi:hypothetical protein UCRPC4_g05962 [Phaeomoniella chlamydospora]|uniref:Uncharacterized protein n=1 Tax=Phaeomoniella chlamydospora TaxID=158046 RepID=A0A0G2GH41_PHACM|nr:hypothetical protein UCRPC4_g05962 [Phaeomoniella chlamydospora]
MVHYVRFLKTPRFKQGKLLSLTTLITITTDLGETFLATDLDLQARVVDERSNRVIVQKTSSWKTGSRDLQIIFEKFPVSLKGQLLRVQVTVDPEAVQDVTSSSEATAIPAVIDAYSAPFPAIPASIAAGLVERKLALPTKKILTVWEETGNSIALHIWDAAIGVLQSLCHAHDCGAKDIEPRLCCLINGFQRPTRIFELGSGCGVVGIALASILNSVQVTLSDLPEAMEIMEKNMTAAKLERNSSLCRTVLDWDSDLSSDLSRNVDIIIVSDCTYNADAIPSLVKVLRSFAVASPNIVIAVAMKRRHESEEVFFDLMTQYFQQTKTTGLKLPHITSDYDPEVPRAEIYYFSAKV